MHFILTRDHFTIGETLGVLTIGGQTFETIERPWVPDADKVGGTPHVSCVPEGTYALVLHDTEKHPRTFALVNEALGVVHNPTEGMRSDILIHPANWARELEGCIAPGRARERDGGGWMVTHSVDAVRAIMSIVPWEEGHTIEIKRATPETNK